MVSLVYVIMGAVALSTMCGASQLESRIISGIQANYTDFPYAISLQNVNNLTLETRGHVCGGAMITLSHAVTSGSCVYVLSGTTYVLRNATEYRVFVGSHLLTDDNSTDNWRSVFTFTPHVNYSGPPSVDYDIAIITLSSAFSSTVLTPISVSTSVPSDGASCTVAGWGSTLPGGTTNVSLLYTSLLTMNQTSCVNASVAAGGPTIESYMLCASKTAVSASCTGDYGNALVCNGTLTGILSWFSECNTTAELEVYTRTASFASWVTEVTDAGVLVAPFTGLLLAAVALSKSLAVML